MSFISTSVIGSQAAAQPGVGGVSGAAIPLRNGWFVAGPVADPSGIDAASWTPVDLPHTVTALSWHDWDPSTWEAFWVYRRRFALPARTSRQRYFLDFSGALSAATVTVNGHSFDRHVGGYLPFGHEITDHVRSGENELYVVVDGRFDVDAPPDRPGQPSSSVDYWQPAGLYREVSVRVVPSTFVADVFAKPVDVLDAGNRRVAIECTVDSSTTAGQVALEFSLWRGNTRVAGTSAAVDVTQPGRTAVAATLPARTVELWDVDSPTLYRLVATLWIDGVVVHDHEIRIGFREARFTTDGFWLNGTRRRLFGLNRHQFFPYLGGAAPARVQRRDAQILRDDLNCTMVRCSHYPQHEAFLDACDELGLLVWEEAPGWGYIGDAAWQDMAVRDVTDMVLRDRNHPSIVVWGARLNETQDDQGLYTRTQGAVRALDDSRPTAGAMVGGLHDTTNFQQDVFGYNDYSSSVAADGTRRPELAPPRRDIPYLVTEAIGTLSGPAKFYRRTDPVTVQQGQALAHARAHDIAGSDTGYAGLLAWCGFDYPSGNGNTFAGVKWPGVVDVFRIPKLGAAIYRSQVAPEHRPVIEPAFYWDFQDDLSVLTLDTALICSNAQRLELYVGGAHLTSLTPARDVYPHLDHPPFLADFSTVDPGGLPELRIDGYIGQRRIASRSYSADRSRDRFTVTADDSRLLADGVDATRIEFGCVDAHGALRPYAAGDVHLSMTGPGRLFGDRTFPASVAGGAGAVWIRTVRDRPGAIVLRATHDVVGAGQAVVITHS